MRIAIIKTSSIGDVLQTIPIAALLKKEMPSVHITWVAEKSSTPILQAVREIDTVIEIDTKTWRKNLFNKTTWQEFESAVRKLCHTSFDAVIDLQGNTKSALFTCFAPSVRKIGFSKPAEWPNRLFTTEKYTPQNACKSKAYLESLQTLLKRPISYDIPSFDLELSLEEKYRLENILQVHFQGKRVLLVCPGTRWENKKLSQNILEQCLLALQQADPETVIAIVALGPDETASAKQVKNAAIIFNDLTLPLWQHIMKHSHGIITVDSAALHLAMLTSTPIFSFFGPSSTEAYHEKRTYDESIQGVCPYEVPFAIRCPKLRSCPSGACIKELQPSMITPRLISWWKNIVSMERK